MLMVMLLFGIFGFAALVIDLGFARLTQRQMQTAVDAAALEGLRWRDVQLWEQLPQTWLANPDFQAQVGVGANPTDPMTPQQRDAVRRWAASQAVGQLFDDNLNAGDDGPGTGDRGGIYGAGPVVQLQGGNDWAGLAGSQLIVAPTTPVYKPVRSDGTPGLELNVAANASSGDLVAGSYGPNASYPPASSGSADPADEDANYNRRDFQSASASAGPAAPSFLARMRRTNNLNDLDNSPGISSSGPPLPILFGSGSMMARSGGSGQLSVASGITARATAIAAAGPAVAGLSANPYTPGLAKTIGRANSSAGAAGALSAQLTPNQLVYIVFNLSQWETLTTRTAVTSVISSAGLLQSSDGKTTYGYVADGSAVDPSDVSAAFPNGRPFLGPSATIGDQAIQYSEADPTEITTEAMAELPTGAIAYVPLIDDGPSSPLSGRVVGFGYVYAVSCAAPGTLALTKGTGMVAAQNASGVLGVPLPVWFRDPTAGSTRTLQLFSEHESYSDFLYAPVLVDHYLGPNATGGN
jgi:hypothetical protein